MFLFLLCVFSISNLTECFLYMNDDFLITEDLLPTHFVLRSGELVSVVVQYLILFTEDVDLEVYGYFDLYKFDITHSSCPMC
jgi:hypothetical protein